MASPPRRGDTSPSFAQTGTDFFLDDDDDDDDFDLDRVDGDHFDADDDGYLDDDDDDDAYELVVANKPRGRSRTQPLDGLSAPRPQRPTTAAQAYTRDEERAVRAKLHRKLVLLAALLYMLSVLDDTNLDAARAAGMDADLQRRGGGVDDWHSRALMAHGVAASAFAWLSLLWPAAPAHGVVAALVMARGVAASLQAVAPSYPSLVALRFLLGIAAVGLAGLPLFLASFFRRHELAFRVAIVLSAAPLLTSFAPALDWLIVSLAALGPIAPWRLLFLLEGFPSVVAAVFAWSAVPDSPRTASCLTDRERLVARLRLDGPPSSSSPPSPWRLVTRHEIVAVARDLSVWLAAAILFLANMAQASLPAVLSRATADMGHGAVASRALAALPYSVAFVLVLLTAHVSDRLRARSGPLIFHALASALAYTLLALAEPLALPPILSYLALYPVVAGYYSVLVLVLVWSINNQPGQTRRAAAFALLQWVGQCGPLVGTRLYHDRRSPYYAWAMGACACAMFAVVALSLALRLHFQRRNRAGDKADRQDLADGSLAEERALVGSVTLKSSLAADGFRYML